MRFTIRESIFKEGGGAFRIRWSTNGNKTEKRFTYNQSNRAQQLARAEVFRRDILARTPDLIPINEYENDIRVTWTEAGVHKIKRWRFTPATYDAQKAVAVAFRNDVQRRLYQG